MGGKYRALYFNLLHVLMLGQYLGGILIQWNSSRGNGGAEVLSFYILSRHRMEPRTSLLFWFYLSRF